MKKKDVIDEYMKIAFANVTDFVEFENNDENGDILKFKNSNDVDGSAVSEIYLTREGPKVKLFDKMKALEFLANYFELNPMDIHKKTFDNAKLKLEEIKMTSNTKDLEEVKISFDYGNEEIKEN